MPDWTVGIGALMIFIGAGFVPPKGQSGVPCWVAAGVVAAVMIVGYLRSHK